MAQIFPKWSNRAPLGILIVLLLAQAVAAGGIWYYFSPEYTDVGYRPVQPVPYSHEIHVGKLGLDCRYCHFSVESSPVAAIPPTETCMNCHRLVLQGSEKLAPIRDSAASGRRMQWVRVHKTPDYAYFDHSAHVNKGVGCVSCHGRVDQMEVVTQMEPLSMGWCLACHRNPEEHLRPLDQVTNMEWRPPRDLDRRMALAHEAMTERQINPPEDCSGCHR